MTTPSAAANAYASLARIADASGGLGKAVGETQGPSFGALLKDAIGGVLEAGKANIVDVVTAVSETEVAVEALVSVRDRMIQAYEEIMRMPI